MSVNNLRNRIERMERPNGGPETNVLRMTDDQLLRVLKPARIAMFGKDSLKHDLSDKQLEQLALGQ